MANLTPKFKLKQKVWFVGTHEITPIFHVKGVAEVVATQRKKDYLNGPPYIEYTLQTDNFLISGVKEWEISE